MQPGPRLGHARMSIFELPQNTLLRCSGINSDAIRLLDRWKSDAMLRYLRIQAAAVTHSYAQLMLDHGAFTFAAGAFDAIALPKDAPATLHGVWDHSELWDDEEP